MPEVCEVALSAIFLSENIMQYSITAFSILGGKYSKTPMNNLDPFKQLLPLTITNVGSKGKQMWFELVDDDNKKIYMLSHFGMDGKWEFKKEKHSNIKLTLKKDNKMISLYFTDHRNFGRLEFIFKQHLFKSLINDIGPDFLKDKLSQNILKSRIKLFLFNGLKLRVGRSDKKIIYVLMNGQKKKDGIGSGIGNYLCCEILYRAGISPHTSIKTIYDNNDLIKKLAYNIKYVIKLSYLTNKTGYLGNNMANFLDAHRKNIKNGTAKDYHSDINIGDDEVFSYFVYRKTKDPYGNIVKREEIIKNRHTYWVPNVQTK